MTSTFAKYSGLARKVFLAGDVAGMTPTKWDTLAGSPELFRKLCMDLENPAYITGIEARTAAPMRPQPPKPVYLRQLFVGEKILLGPTDGMRTIARAKNVFTGFIDPNFIKWGLDVAARPTGETEFAALEQIKNGNFVQSFDSIGYPREHLCGTQHQIIEYSVRHKDRLHEGIYGNFFLFQVESKLFVANVGVSSGGCLAVRLYRFLGGYAWGARYRRRFVIPHNENL